MSRARSKAHFRPEGAQGGKDPNEGFTDTRLMGNRTVMRLLFGEAAADIVVAAMAEPASDAALETEDAYQVPEVCIDPTPDQLAA